MIAVSDEQKLAVKLAGNSEKEHKLTHVNRLRKKFFSDYMPNKVYKVKSNIRSKATYVRKI